LTNEKWEKKMICAVLSQSAGNRGGDGRLNYWMLRPTPLRMMRSVRLPLFRHCPPYFYGLPSITALIRLASLASSFLPFSHRKASSCRVIFLSFPYLCWWLWQSVSSLSLTLVTSDDGADEWKNSWQIEKKKNPLTNRLDLFSTKRICSSTF
jgi:hypothetical protein